MHVVGEDAEVHADVAGEERQRQEDRGDDGERVDDLGLPAPRLIALCAQEGMLPADLTAWSAAFLAHLERTPS